MSASSQLTKYIKHCITKDDKPFRSDVGPLQTQKGVVVFVNWFLPGPPASTGQASGFLDVHAGDSTLVSVPSPSGQPATKIPMPTSISGSAYWLGGFVPGRGIAGDTFTLKVKSPDPRKNILQVDIAGLALPGGTDSVSTTLTVSPFANDETNFTGTATTSQGRQIVFVLSMTTGTQVLNLAA